MGNRKNHLILDVETVGTNAVFDIAWAVCNCRGIQTIRNYLVKEIYSCQTISNFPFHGEKKAKLYENKVDSGEVEIVPWREILLNLMEDLQNSSIDAIWAYNVIFDVGAIAYTSLRIRDREFRLFDNYKIYDLYTAFCMQMSNRKDYSRFCREFGLVSKAGNIQTKAECAIKFIRNDPNYIELHTAREDVVDEFEIFRFIRNTKKKRNIPAIPNPWKLVQKEK